MFLSLGVGFLFLCVCERERWNFLFSVQIFSDFKDGGRSVWKRKHFIGKMKVFLFLIVGEKRKKGRKGKRKKVEGFRDLGFSSNGLFFYHFFVFVSRVRLVVGLVLHKRLTKLFFGRKKGKEGLKSLYTLADDFSPCFRLSLSLSFFFVYFSNS